MKPSVQTTTAVSVILPTYNEAGNIVPLLFALRKALIDHRYDIVVVDDNSPDGTADLVSAAVKKNKWNNVSVLQRMAHRGLTNSIVDGIARTTGDIVCWMDCDFSMPPTLLPVMIDAVLTEGYDAAVGSRFMKGGKQKSKGESDDSSTAIGLSTGLNMLLKILFRFDFHDYTSGFIAVKRTVLDTLPLQGDYGEYFIDFMCRFLFAGYTVKELPYVCAPRLSGESKTGATTLVLVRHSMQYAMTVFSIIWKRMSGVY